MSSEPTFIICVSQPGCLPECDPTAVQGVENARTALAEEIRATAHAHDVDGTPVDLALKLANELGTTGTSVRLSGYVHEAIPKLSETNERTTR